MKMDILPIRGIYEIAVRVRDLSRAETFYCEVLGLREGLRDEQRNWLFLHLASNQGMVVLQEDKGDWPKQHFAFEIPESAIEQTIGFLRKQGVEVSEPVQHGWMGATSVYFEDPDGHALELIATNQAANR